MRIAIAVTIHRWTQDTNVWIDHHLGLGFDRLYVFVDDPRGAPTGSPSAVRVTVCERGWWDHNRGSPLSLTLDAARTWNTPEWRHPQHVMLRQVLNVEAALGWALAEEVTWLLHIDGDELFHTVALTPAEHFAQLERLGIVQARYLNHEAVVGREETEDPLRRMRLFRKNRATLSGRARKLVEEHFTSKRWFVSYSNGKSAVRVSPDVRPRGVHSFELPDGACGQCVLSSPAILHFPYTGFEQFRVKHESLGTFDATSFLGEEWRPPLLLSLAQKALSSGDPEAMHRLFREHVLLDETVVAALRECAAVEELPSP